MPPQDPSSSSGATANRPPALQKKDIALDEKIIYEFGGPWGVTILMITFPILMLYFYICLAEFDGKLMFPGTEFWNVGLPLIAPNLYATNLYVGFNVFQAITAMTMPGVVIKGLPVPSLGGKQLEYLCNGVATWYLDIIVLVVLNETRWLPLADIVDNIGPITTVAILFGIFVTIATYVVAVATGTTHRMSGNVMYDMFMGGSLNPRIGNLDLKMWAEIRIPWKILFFVTLSAAIKEHEVKTALAEAAGLPTRMDLFGGMLSLPIIRTSAELIFMSLAHLLYVNACMKGEECIPTTWDIFYEKWGFMLIFWNFAGVPFSYCYSSIYILNHSLKEGVEPVTHYPAYTFFLFVVLLVAYYVWDTANSQKNRFRMTQRGTYVKRNTFPQFKFGYLENPSFIQTEHGNKLLTGGWWGMARKIHYTADLIMALSWGLITGTDSFIPYFYVFFFTVVLVHRVSRDMEHCAEKYGKDWDRYCKEVPYIFIPGIF